MKYKPENWSCCFESWVLHVLLALAEGPLHGYAIMKAVEELSESSLSTGPGNIYGFSGILIR